MDDLRDTPLQLVDETSFGGWDGCLRELKKAGIDPYRISKD